MQRRLIIRREDVLVLDKLGEGAQGVVHLARWKGMSVVYKQMKWLADEKEKQALVKECAIWQYVIFIAIILILIIYYFTQRLVSHPSSVALYGVVDEAQQFGFVAEYCSNGSLYLTTLLLIIRVCFLIIKGIIGFGAIKH